MRTIRWLTALAALALAACGGGSNGGCNGNFAGGNCGGTTGASAVASVLLVSDVSSIPSDNSVPAHITAYVRDGNNNFVSGIPVVFTVDTGGITVTQGTTDANGQALATVNTLGDKTNRTITVTATADKKSNTAQVAVSGTTLTLQGATALTAGQTSTYTATLLDGGQHGISGVALTVTVPSNLTASTTTLTTDATGKATFTATGGTGGSGSLQLAGMGMTTSLSVQVNGDNLTFTAPTAGTNVPLNTVQTVTAKWVQNGTPQVGAQMTFSTTRGCINPAGTTCTGQVSSATAVTDATGAASVQVLSDNAGGATLSASVVSGGTPIAGTTSLQFISTVASSIDVQPSLFTLSPSTSTTTNSSTITAVVRDANNNLVTGVTVLFSLNDITGGSLSVPSSVTDTNGRAQSVYSSGTVASAANGVAVTATVSGTSITKTVLLTVSKTQAFISIGTGNAIRISADKTQYLKDYVVQVTDANGAGVPNVALSMSVLSDYYFKGYRSKSFSTDWADCYTVPVDQCTPVAPATPIVTLSPPESWGCADEDVNHNGILDPGEDFNNNGKIDAGNIASVSPASVTTDASGFASVTVAYPEEYAYWLEVTLQAQAQVQGTAYYAQSKFMLPGATDDYKSSSVPAGTTSPFGVGLNHQCSDTL